MKKLLFLCCICMVAFGSCKGDLQVSEEQSYGQRKDTHFLYTDLFINEFSKVRNDRCVVSESTKEISLDDFYTLYLSGNSNFKIHYEKIIQILSNYDLDIDEVNNELKLYTDSISDLSDYDMERILLCVSAAEATILYFLEDPSYMSRGIRSWFKKNKSRIANAAISAVCGAIIGGAIGGAVGVCVPVIGYIPGAIVGGVTYGVIAGKEGYTRDEVYITSGPISL